MDEKPFDVCYLVIGTFLVYRSLSFSLLLLFFLARRKFYKKTSKKLEKRHHNILQVKRGSCNQEVQPILVLLYLMEIQKKTLSITSSKRTNFLAKVYQKIIELRNFINTIMWSKLLHQKLDEFHL